MALAAEFAKYGMTYPQARATMVLRRAMSGKQRARLDAKTALHERTAPANR